MDEADLDHERARVATKLRLRPKLLTASALTGRHVDRILTEAIALGDRMRNRIPTPELNRFLSEVVAGAPAAGQAGPPAQAPLHGADRDAPAALRDPGQLAHARHARLRLLRREPPAPPLRAWTACRSSSTSTSAPSAAATCADRAPGEGSRAERRGPSVPARGRARRRSRCWSRSSSGWPRQLPGADPAAFFRWKHLESPFGPVRHGRRGGRRRRSIGFEALHPLARQPPAAGRVVGAARRGHRRRTRPIAAAGSRARSSGAATAGIARRLRLRLQQPQRSSDPMLVKLGRRPVGPFDVLVRPAPAAAHARARRRAAAGRAARASPPRRPRRGAGGHRGARRRCSRGVPRAGGRLATALDRRLPALEVRLGGRLPGDPRAPRRTASRPGHLPRRPRGGPLWALAAVRGARRARRPAQSCARCCAQAPCRRRGSTTP